MQIYEFPTYKIVAAPNSTRLHPSWNVLCSAYGDSGYLYRYDDVEEWVAKRITKYVKLIDHRPIAQKLERAEAKAKELGYESLDDLFAHLNLDHTGD